MARHVKTGDPTLRRTFSLIACALILFAPTALAAEGGKAFEKTVDVPHDTGVWVEIAYEKVSLMWVAISSAPTARDVDNATKRDPQDKTPMLVRFHYKNESYVKQKVEIRVELLDAKGAVMAHGGRKGSLDGKQKDDTLSLPVIVKTMDWPKAVKMKVTATFK